MRPAATQPALDFDPTGPLFAPRLRRESSGAVQVLIDTDRVGWLAVNERGQQLLAAADGRPGSELLASYGERGRPRMAAERFLRQVARKGFLANAPFVPPAYEGRRERLEPVRLHEFWVLTNDDCNLRCQHCYTIDRVRKGDKGLAAETLKAIIDEARDLGTEVFYFTGGEPFRRDDLLELIAHVATRSKLIVFTNGTLITPELARQMEPYRERLIFQVSLDGDGDEHMRPVRGKSFDEAWRGVRTLLEHGLRVGVSSTPTGAAWRSIADLTERLARLEVGGRRVEYHHLIMLLDQGGAVEKSAAMGITGAQFGEVLSACRERIRSVRQDDPGCRLVLANDKIFKALASHGPRKDLCGAGYTILGMSADGELHPCAATINDSRHNCGRLIESDGTYHPGRLTHLWWNDEHIETVRKYTLARQEGESAEDLRYFHGGGCWYNMNDPQGPFSREHPFAEVYEDFTLKEILKKATQAVDEVSDEVPECYQAMHRRRIACAGERKTKETGAGEVDNGYCICFA